MKKIVLMGVATVLAMTGAAGAQEASEATYEQSMECAALYMIASGALEGDDDEAAMASADLGMRWLAMAYARSGEDEDRMEREIETYLEALAERLDAEGEEGTYAEELESRCAALAIANAEEFDSFDFDEGDF